MKPEYYRETEYNENKEINSRKSQPSGNKKPKLEPIQQTGNFKKFTRVFPPLERSETYRGVEQPEPELCLGPVTAVESKDWEREMFRSVRTDKSYQIQFLIAHRKLSKVIGAQYQ